MFDDPDFLKNTNKKLRFTDSAASYFVVGLVERGLPPILDKPTGRVSVNINGLQYEAQLNYRGFPGSSDAEKQRSYSLQGGIIYHPVLSTLSVNNAITTAMAINIWPLDGDF